MSGEIHQIAFQFHLDTTFNVVISAGSTRWINSIPDNSSTKQKEMFHSAGKGWAHPYRSEAYAVSKDVQIIMFKSIVKSEG